MSNYLLTINMKIDKSDSFWTVEFTVYHMGCQMKAVVEVVNVCLQIIKRMNKIRHVCNKKSDRVSEPIMMNLRSDTH